MGAHTSLQELQSLEGRVVECAAAADVLDASHAPLDDEAVEAHWRLRYSPIALEVGGRADGCQP